MDCGEDAVPGFRRCDACRYIRTKTIPFKLPNPETAKDRQMFEEYKVMRGLGDGKA